LSKVAAEEQRLLQTDIGTLRNVAYLAQRGAADQRQRAEAARRALGETAMESWHLRETIGVVRAEISAEMAALNTSQAAQQQEEAAAATLKSCAREEAAELSAMCESMRKRRIMEEERVARLQQELAAARTDRLLEAQAARGYERRAQAASVARERALANLADHEDLAAKTLSDSIAQLEADFNRERADFQERERRATARIQEMELQVDQRRRPPGVPHTGIWLPS